MWSILTPRNFFNDIIPTSFLSSKIQALNYHWPIVKTHQIEDTKPTFTCIDVPDSLNLNNIESLHVPGLHTNDVRSNKKELDQSVLNQYLINICIGFLKSYSKCYITNISSNTQEMTKVVTDTVINYKESNGNILIPLSHFQLENLKRIFDAQMKASLDKMHLKLLIPKDQKQTVSVNTQELKPYIQHKYQQTFVYIIWQCK